MIEHTFDWGMMDAHAFDPCCDEVSIVTVSIPVVAVDQTVLEGHRVDSSSEINWCIQSIV